MRGVAEAEAEQRHGGIGQAEGFGGGGDIVAQGADIYAAQAERFGSQQHILRGDAGVHGAQQQRFGIVGLDIWHEAAVFGVVDAEHEEFRRKADVFLLGGNLIQPFAHGVVGNADDVDALHEAGGRSGAAGLEHGGELLRRNGLGSEFADGAVSQRGGQHGLGVKLGGHGNPVLTVVRLPEN